MATIAFAPTRSFPQGEQQSQVGAAGGSTASDVTQDPLFEALAKYITSGPGPSSVSASEIQQILDVHVNEEGGRAYLESVVNPPESGSIVVWDQHSFASGTIKVTRYGLNLEFKLDSPEGRVVDIFFKGFFPGLFVEGVHEFSKAHFRYKDLPFNETVQLKGLSIKRLSTFAVQFLKGDQSFAELVITGVGLFLPDHPIFGSGKFWEQPF